MAPDDISLFKTAANGESYPPPSLLDKPFGYLQKRINVAKGNFISYSFCQTNVRRFASPFLQERRVAEKNINTLQFNLLSFHLDQRKTIKFYGLNAIHRSPKVLPGTSKERREYQNFPLYAGVGSIDKPGFWGKRSN